MHRHASKAETMRDKAGFLDVVKRRPIRHGVEREVVAQMPCAVWTA